MKDQHLFLRYTLAGDSRVHVKTAFRVVIDGKGGLLLHQVEGVPERLTLAELESFSIHKVAAPRGPAAAAA